MAATLYRSVGDENWDEIMSSCGPTCVFVASAWLVQAGGWLVVPVRGEHAMWT